MSNLTEASLQTLTRVPIFSSLAPDELAFLAARAKLRQHGAGELVFGEGERCEGLYIVQTGRLRIFKSSPDGREQVLSIDGPASSVAELPVFDGGTYPASAGTIEETTLIFISRENFQELCLSHPQVALKVLRVVGARLRRLVGIIEELSFTTVRHRLATMLVKLARHQGERNEEGVAILLQDSHQEIAAQIGTVRELVSRNLSRLQGEGILRIQGREILITDLEKLEAEMPG